MAKVAERTSGDSSAKHAELTERCAFRRRLDGMWAFYALCMAAALVAIIAALIDFQWLASFATGTLLVILVVYALLSVVGAAILEVASDGCEPCTGHFCFGIGRSNPGLLHTPCCCLVPESTKRVQPDLGGVACCVAQLGKTNQLGVSFVLLPHAPVPTRRRCQNLEAQLRLRLAENIHNPATLAKFLPLVDYYLSGAGGSLVAVVKTAFNLDIPKLLARLTTVRGQINDVSS